MAQSNNAVLVVRVAKGKARIWTTDAPKGTVGATTLSQEASNALRDAVNALPKGEFANHQAALAAGTTVRARGDKRIAALISEAIAGTTHTVAAGKSKRGQNRRRGNAPAQQAPAPAKATGAGKGRPAKGSQEAKDMMAAVRAARGGGKPAQAPAQPARTYTKSDLTKMTKAEIIAAAAAGTLVMR